MIGLTAVRTAAAGPVRSSQSGRAVTAITAIVPIPQTADSDGRPTGSPWGQ
jgi:hypothetical protein